MYCTKVIEINIKREEDKDREKMSEKEWDKKSG